MVASVLMLSRSLDQARVVGNDGGISTKDCGGTGEILWDICGSNLKIHSQIEVNQGKQIFFVIETLG